MAWCCTAATKLSGLYFHITDFFFFMILNKHWHISFSFITMRTLYPRMSSVSKNHLVHKNTSLLEPDTNDLKISLKSFLNWKLGISCHKTMLFVNIL